MKNYAGRACRVATFLFCFGALAIASVAAPVPVPRQSGQPSLRATLKGHTTLVYSVAFSPDGKTLASGSMDGTLKLWDVATGKQRASLKGQGLSTTPLGRRRGGIRVELQPLKGESLFTTSVAFSPDGKTLASANKDGSIRLCDVKTGKDRATFRGHAGFVSSIAYSPNGKTLASGSLGGTLIILDAKTGLEASSITHPGRVTSLAYSPDSNMLVSASHAVSIEFKADGSILELDSDDETITLWDVKTGKKRATLKGHTEKVPFGRGPSVACSPDGKTIASGSVDGTIRLWDVKTSKQRFTFTGHTNAVVSVAFSPGGKTLASGSDDKTIKLWDVKTGKQQAALKGQSKAVNSVAYSPDGKMLASSSGKMIQLWDMPDAKRGDK